MKKRFIHAIALVMGVAMSMSMTSCDDDDDKSNAAVDYSNIDYTAKNAANWGNYMEAVATYLSTDANTLYSEWASTYASTFKADANAVEDMIAGCMDIANEVGVSKIGDPIEKYEAGNTTEALYAVESWYSWHSIDDYANNIRSIRNVYYGSRDGSVAANSLYNAVKAVNSDKAEAVNSQILATIAAIEAIPAPFRNNINSSEAKAAQSACAELKDALNGLNSELEKIDAATLSAVAANFVDVVALPTYEELADANEALLAAVKAFKAAPSNSGFETLAAKWLASREPWESSEAFLFGPVADLGLDPNMDSWPLAQADIYNILTSGDFSALSWTGEYDESSSAIEAAQAIRGFHTLEFLIFKNGKARTISE